jgi:hypothetical protein
MPHLEYFGSPLKTASIAAISPEPRRPPTIANAPVLKSILKQPSYTRIPHLQDGVNPMNDLPYVSPPNNKRGSLDKKKELTA